MIWRVLLIWCLGVSLATASIKPHYDNTMNPFSAKKIAETKPATGK
jgi:hypothetical protein